MTEKEIPAWVVVGAEVMHVRSGSWNTTYGATAKIAKVHKNGNFTLEGDATRKQWKPWVRDRVAVPAGDHYGAGSLQLVTPELLAQKDRTERLGEARRIVRAEAERLRMLQAEDAILAAAEAISAPAELVELRQWRDDAFVAHQNLDLDVERVRAARAGK